MFGIQCPLQDSPRRDLRSRKTATQSQVNITEKLRLILEQLQLLEAEEAAVDCSRVLNPDARETSCLEAMVASRECSRY